MQAEKKEKGLSGFTKKKYVMNEEASWDIDTMLDWKFVEALLKEDNCGI